MNYSILTAARNEASYIGYTLRSVTGQTSRPTEWIIIDDGSTDSTAEIIESFVKENPWIKLFSLHNFRTDLKTTGGRVGHLLNIARKKLSIQVDLIIKLDADIAFKEDFFTKILDEFKKQPKLGIASGQLYYHGTPIRMQPGETKGAVMVIRTTVFEEIGGFFESRGRGEDTLFSIAARAKGWRTENFPIAFDHLKPEGVRESPVRNAFITGQYKGSIPYRADYFLLTQIKHIKSKPILLGSLVQLTGYFLSRFILRYRPFPKYVATQLHSEQKAQIKRIFRRKKP